jgi:predicted unusual protein kinase regulating ubiquinone biosynthesis (AarF/ABC1/UbiB family)
VIRFLAENKVRLVFQKDRPRVGKWMREELVNMGPAFIKFGQFLSTRPDIVGSDIVKELELLQDDIRSVPFSEISATIDTALAEKGLGAAADVFSYIDPIPLATASIGQVHRGRHRGREIVLKVQKPGVAQQIREDLDTMKNLNSVYAKTGSVRSHEISTIVRQYEQFLSAELDFEKERSNMNVFIKIMEEAELPVKVPRPVERLSSSTVLVMEYVPSLKITDVGALRARGIDTTAIADMLIKAFLYQIITAAVVHCDPHPGNIGVTEDGETLVLYDYGNVIRLSTKFKDELSQIVFAMYQKDVDEFVEILTKLRILRLTTENEKMEAKSFFAYFFNYLESLDFSTLRASISNGEFSDTIQTKLKLDADFFSLLRVFSLLDGTCVKLDKDFNYIDALAPFSDDLMFDMNFMDYRARKDFNKMRGYPSMLQFTDMNVIRVQNRVQQMEAMQSQVKVMMAVWIVADFWDKPAILAAIICVTGTLVLVQRYKKK